MTLKNLRSSQQLNLSAILKTETLWNNEQIWWQACGQDGWKYHGADHHQLKAVNSFKSNYKLLTAVDSCLQLWHRDKLLPALITVPSCRQLWYQFQVVETIWCQLWQLLQPSTALTAFTSLCHQQKSIHSILTRSWHQGCTGQPFFASGRGGVGQRKKSSGRGNS